MPAFMAANEGAGYRRLVAYDYVKASLEKMFREQDNEKPNFNLSPQLPTLKDYFHSAIKSCLKLADSGNREAKKRLPEIFFRLALYYESGDIGYGIVKNLKEADKFLELAIKLESEQVEEIPGVCA